MEYIIIFILILIIVYCVYTLLSLDYFNNANKIPDKILIKQAPPDPYILPKVIYGFWDNLDENIIIQSHIRSWKRHLSSEWKIVILNKNTVYDYVDKSFINKYGSGELDATRFSDFLRIDLLTKKGGCWMDASIFITDGGFLDNMYDEMIKYKYDACFYEYKEMTMKASQPHIDNWFMMAPKGSKILTDLYYEFNRAYEMDFLKYKRDVLMNTNIIFTKTIGYGDNTYLLQHAIFHYLLRNGNPYNIELKNATESFFKMHSIYNWDQNEIIDFLINNTNWNNLYAIKLTKANRAAIKDQKAYVRKIDSL